jgi:hypothetical protein
MVVPTAVLTAQPAGAAGGTTCKTFTGSVTFHPPLPPLGSKATVKGYFTVAGKLSGCTGVVRSATVSGKSVTSKTGQNCQTIATSKTPNTVNLTTKWNNGKTSTGKLTSKPGSNPTIQTVTGTTASGLFKGLHTSTTVQYTIPSGQCSSKPGSKFTLKNTKPVVIK